MSEKKQISLSEVVAMIESGKKRPEIRQELGLSSRDARMLFSHPEIKNRKARKKTEYVPEIEIIDDLTSDADVEVAQVEPETTSEPGDEPQSENVDQLFQ